MGLKSFKGDRKNPTDDDIKELEQKIKTFCNENEQKIKNVFNSQFHAEEKIEIHFGDNDQITKNDKGEMLTDFVIQWSIPGNMNSTNCRLTFFNLGSFLGANGFLFSICTFYSYFFNIENIDNSKIERKGIIQNCLNYIDNKDKEKLKAIWKVDDINDDVLKTLRIAKNFLINNIYMSKEEIKEDINTLIEDNFNGIWKKTKGFAKKLWMMFTHLFHKKSYNQNEKDYIDFKNNLNKKKIFEKIYLLFQNFENFKNNNIFILATDDNTIKEKNCYSTFMCHECKGLGKNRKARKLNSDDEDGFIGNEDILVYEYYWQIIYDLQKFLTRNKKRIDNINKGINIEFNISKIIEDIDDNETLNNSKEENDHPENGNEESNVLIEKLIVG